MMDETSEILHRLANIPVDAPRTVTLSGYGIETVYGTSTHTLAKHPQTGAKYVCAGNPFPGSASFGGCVPLKAQDHFICSRDEAMRLEPLRHDPVERTQQPMTGRCTFAT